MDEQMYKDAEKALDDLIESCGIPKGHPFNNGEKSHHSIGFLALMILNIYLGEQEVIIDYIKKCKAMEGNVFNFEKFNQAIMEPIILYYLVVNLIEVEFQYIRYYMSQKYIGMVKNWNIRCWLAVPMGKSIESMLRLRHWNVIR